MNSTSPHHFLHLLTLLIVALPASMTRADRAGMQMDPAYMYEKAGDLPQAALYYHRVLRGWKEYYIPFLWGEASNAPGKYIEYQQLLGEFTQRLDKCLADGKIGPEQLKHIEFINDLWMNELLEQEEGETRTESHKRAIESERRGDFRLADVLRQCDARFYRMVLVPYHRKSAEACRKAGQESQAKLHDDAAAVYEQRAAEAELLAAGDKLLMKFPGFGGPSPWVGIQIGKTLPLAIPSAYWSRVITTKGEWKGKDPQEVAAVLEDQGLKHSDEAARYASVIVLANFGDRPALISALADSSPSVRRAAAKALAAMQSADGWAACHAHADADIRNLIKPLLKPAPKDIASRAWIIVELLRGLESSSSATKTFCHSALQSITAQNLAPAQWPAWWKNQGNFQPGLKRSGPGVPDEVDPVIDFGGWWHSGRASIQRLPNPLVKYTLPATVQWTGQLVVPQTAQYRFYARNCSQSIRQGKRISTPGRTGFPGMFFSSPAVKIFIDDKLVVGQNENDAVLDPAGGIRLDYGPHVQLDQGLHSIRVEFVIRSYDDEEATSKMGMIGGLPSIRLYWSSDQFLRQLVPTQCLLTRS